MVDPAVAYQPNKSYLAFDRGVQDDVFLKELNGSLHKGVVWPGVTVYPGMFKRTLHHQYFINQYFSHRLVPSEGRLLLDERVQGLLQPQDWN